MCWSRRPRAAHIDRAVRPGRHPRIDRHPTEGAGKCGQLGCRLAFGGKGQQETLLGCESDPVRRQQRGRLSRLLRTQVLPRAN